MSFGDSAAARTGDEAFAAADPCTKRCREEFSREVMALTAAGLIAGVAVVLLGQVVAGAWASASALHLGSALLGGLCVVGTFMLFARMRLIPASEMQAWAADRVADAIARIDGNPTLPSGPQELLDRLEGRTGPSASFLRVGALWQLGRADEARKLLEAWEPSEPADVCRRERLAAAMDAPAADVHLARVEAAIADIADPAERSAQRASFVLDSARARRRQMWPGLSALAAARAELGPFYELSKPPVQPPARPARIAATSAGFVFSLIAWSSLEISPLFAVLVLALALGPFVISRISGSRAPDRR